MTPDGCQTTVSLRILVNLNKNPELPIGTHHKLTSRFEIQLWGAVMWLGSCYPTLPR
jgi:hypothetical protein